ncbi:MAG: SirB2 family protein [Gammaproteobacteria bacterium]|jgi:uncharacterized membrane protein SirB2|nr:SirB2 family protein [Gammaproteobacteria bacterium]
MYAVLKVIHLGTVALSIGLFSARLFWAYTAPARLARPWVRTLPHVIDTVLLASAVGLTLVLHQYPFVQPWLTAKVFAVVLYIICGSVALKRARTRAGRNFASFAALSSVGYIILVATTRDPWPFG